MWWSRQQRRLFNAALSAVTFELTSNVDFAVSHGLPEIEEIAKRDITICDLGDKFSQSMRQFCRTSKFESLGYQDVYASIASRLPRQGARI